MIEKEKRCLGIVNLTIKGRNDAAWPYPLCTHRVLPNLKRLRS
jgi:hypothetical protein